MTLVTVVAYCGMAPAPEELEAAIVPPLIDITLSGVLLRKERQVCVFGKQLLSLLAD